MKKKTRHIDPATAAYYASTQESSAPGTGFATRAEIRAELEACLAALQELVKQQN